MKRSYVALKNEFENGQAIKKRAVIQLIQTTASGQKKFFSRWLGITEKSHLLNECKLVSNLMASLNYVIKSVADSAFVDNKDNVLKEKALMQLYKNLNVNVSDCFKRWKDVNSVERIKERFDTTIDKNTKEAVVKTLENLLKNSKQDYLRDVFNKFRINRRIVEIQRNFLKKLLLSKAGLVVIAFKKFQSLPVRIEKKNP